VGAKAAGGAGARTVMSVMPAAIAEMWRIAGLLGVADTPGFADALADAEAGRFSGVPMGSPLEYEVRAGYGRRPQGAGPQRPLPAPNDRR
jgi:hypothetical protein